MQVLAFIYGLLSGIVCMIVYRQYQELATHSFFSVSPYGSSAAASVQLDLSKWKKAITFKGIHFALSANDTCENLFQDADLGILETDESYMKKKAAFAKHLSKSWKGHIEGNTNKYKEQQLFYWILGSITSVRTVCEIGFNAGHSALLWLESNPNIHLHSFDINQHSYTEPMADYLKEQYPGRFDIHFGKSDYTIPSVGRDGHVLCDILIVDGGHFKDQPLKDIMNMKRLSKKDSLLIVDDTDAHSAVMNAVNKLQDVNYIKLHFTCLYKFRTHGFSVFTYI